MKLTKTLIIILLCAGFTELKSDTFEQQEERVQIALKAMYNREYKRAASLFHQVLNSTPFHPMGPLGALAVEYYQNEGLIGYHQRNQQFLVDIEQALQIYSEQIKQNPSHSEYFFFYGTVMGLRARIQLAEKNYFGVLTSGYNAIRFIKKTEKLYPDQPDFQLPVGLFNYYVSISAPYMKIASRLMRESGSRSEGLQAIKADADYGNYGRYEARSLLAYLYLYFESNYSGAYEYARKMAEDFPKNPYYAALTADAAIQIGQLDQAYYYLKRIEALLPTLPPKTQKDYRGILHLLYGSLALAQGRLGEAESNLIEFIKSYDYELDYDLGNALVRLGNVYDLQKRRSEAIACYRKAVQLNNRTAAVSLANQYLKQPYNRN